jgi:hypothetical protein
MARLSSHFGNPVLCNRARISGLHDCFTTEQMRMASVAPSIDGHHVEVAGIGVRLWKSARQQVWQFGVEARQVEAEPLRGFGRPRVSRFSDMAHAAPPVLALE